MQNELAVQWQNTKTQQSREIPISPALRELLVRRQKAHPLASTPWAPTDYVFGNEIGARVVDIRTAWDTAVLKAHGVEQPRSLGGRMAPDTGPSFRRSICTFTISVTRRAAGSWKPGGRSTRSAAGWATLS